MSDKIYCGSGKKKDFPNGGSIISVCLDMTTLAANWKEYGFTTQAGKKMIKVNVAERKEIDTYDNTHYVIVDTWKPTEQQGSNQQQSGSKQQQNHNDFVDDDSDIPF